MIPTIPEFRRQLWLEFSPLRLITLPILLGLVFYVAYSTSFKKEGLAPFYETSSMLLFVGLFLFGSYKAASSFIEEITENTWDFQKMSPQSAWKLALGKLFGGTSYVWYGAFLCLPFFLVGFHDRYDNVGLTHSIFLILCLFLSAIFGHAVALLLAIDSASYKKPNAFGYALVGCFVSALSYNLGHDLVQSYAYNFTQSNKIITWFGTEWNGQGFILLSLLYYMTWSLIGVWRSMRKELQYKDIPVAWITFLLTFTLYLAGFMDRGFSSVDNNFVKPFLESIFSQDGIALPLPNLLRNQFIMVLGVMLMSSYIWAFLESRNFVKYRQFFHRLKQKNYRKAAESIPVWFLSAAIALVVYVVVILSSPFKHYDLWATVILFFSRDILAMHVFFFNPKAKRAALAFGVYCAVAYFLLPFVPGIKSLFVPTSGNIPLLLFSLGVQTLINFTLFLKRWKSLVE